MPNSSAGFITLSAKRRMTAMLPWMNSSSGVSAPPLTKSPAKSSSLAIPAIRVLHASKMSSDTFAGVKANLKPLWSIAALFWEVTMFQTISKTCVLISPLFRISFISPSMVSVLSKSALLRCKGTTAREHKL
mmetsp:Transcript_51107/g.89184  ORF Transcript_51107/g.89184 Transcript_51107/m.89184 type:complete len:132 (-) Transcript_51107:506-901(-)